MRQCEYFREVSIARMKEIDEIRAAGGQTELEIWWNSLEENKKHKSKKCEPKKYEYWKDEDVAFMVQRRPHITFKVIASCLGKSLHSCQKKYKKVKLQGKLDYYMNYKLETLNNKN